MSLEKEFVPYDRSLKLKEIGFDRPCFAIWNKGWYENEWASHGLERLFSSKFRLNHTQSCEYYANSKDDSKIAAPTYSQAFSWFREKYGVHSSPRKYDETKWWVEWGSWTSDVFETFEEAELSWLDKLLDIVESQIK